VYSGITPFVGRPLVHQLLVHVGPGIVGGFAKGDGVLVVMDDGHLVDASDGSDCQKVGGVLAVDEIDVMAFNDRFDVILEVRWIHLDKRLEALVAVSIELG
jgi:hypothetical protein